MKLTEAQLRQLIRERLTQFSNKPWTVDVVISAPKEEGGNFQNDDPIIITNPHEKSKLDVMFKMDIPDPEGDEAYSQVFGDAPGDDRSHQTPERERDIERQVTATEREWKRQDMQDAPTKFEEGKMKIKLGQLKELIREAAKRRPSGWLPATEKNLDLDKPFTADSWITNITGVPVNVLVRNYLKSMGLLDEDDE